MNTHLRTSFEREFRNALRTIEQTRNDRTSVAVTREELAQLADLAGDCFRALLIREYARRHLGIPGLPETDAEAIHAHVCGRLDVMYPGELGELAPTLPDPGDMTISELRAYLDQVEDLEHLEILIELEQGRDGGRAGALSALRARREELLEDPEDS